MTSDGTHDCNDRRRATTPASTSRASSAPHWRFGAMWRVFVKSIVVLSTCLSLRFAGATERGDRIDALSDRFELPATWRVEFWKSTGAQALLDKCLGEVMDLVPVQAGFRFCRCPACGAEEQEDALTWSIENPEVVKCRHCGVCVPNDRFPAKVDKEVPQERIEVQRGVVHRYPYHAVEEEKARYPGERLYLAAKCDYEARKYLARAALYAAAEHRARGAAEEKFGALACVIMLRFAQVYPHYATHSDQPGRPKLLQTARLQPPYRSGYQTAKWEWSGSREVPLNLLLARTLLRNDPAWRVAGKLMSDPAPEQTVDRQLFRATAEFARAQPEEYSEESLWVYQGMLAVGRLIDDPLLVNQAALRLGVFARRGFYHDGFWRQADARSHRRIVGHLDGSIAALLGSAPELPILELARRAAGTIATRAPEEAIQQASWPPPAVPAFHRQPVLFGGAGVAELAVGNGENALDLEVRGLDSYGGLHFQRLALRLAAAGQPVLDDLDERGGTATGWDQATASHNTVVVDGLNQRETPLAARTPTAGSDFQFFAADADFQVVAVSDPRAYPQSTARYRQTVVVTAGPRARYAVSVFEVEGGLQHDQIFHAAPGRTDRWALSVASERPPGSLLPPSITFLPAARLEEGRWFVQAYGEFRLVGQAVLAKPAVAGLVARAASSGRAEDARAAASSPGVRLHILGDMPASGFMAKSPDPEGSGEPASHDIEAPGRASLIIRRRSLRGETLNSKFVTVFEPVGKAFPPLRRVGRVASDADVVILLVETEGVLEYVLVNLKPGSTCRAALPGGRYVSFDGLAVRLREQELVLAGGTFAEGAGKLVSQATLEGEVTASIRRATERGRGWFLTPQRLADNPAIAGRTLVVKHGDRTCRAWTLDSLESTPEGTRLYVREEPGFLIDPKDGSARYYQFPQVRAPGPHHFSLGLITR